MSEETEPRREYALGHSSGEIERLTAQAKLLEPFTRRVFEEAGIRQGMRVLDVGTGSGDVAFQESDHSGARSFPPMPLWERLFELTGRANELSGAELRMGLKLYQTFIAAGLPAPVQQVNVGIIGAQDAAVEPLANFMVQALRSLTPAILKHGLATAEEIDVETYVQRMIREFRAGGGVWLSPPLIGAWTRKEEVVAAGPRDSN